MLIVANAGAARLTAVVVAGCTPLVTESVVVSTPSSPIDLAVDPTGKAIVYVATQASGVLAYRVDLP
ncbi:MAG: hypothetical protein D6812_08590 [Deltaproteobacteria bacterium]|nr:MAG: hypothetical protein D6812_08590 [Deltaproteobacteria bacterium]